MNSESILNGQRVLVVDDEPDILHTVSELLYMCKVYTAGDYDSALKILLNETFNIVILDIMGVNGFELLEKSVLRGFDTIILTAHAVTAESLKKSIKLGAAAFLPKDYINDLEEVVEDILLGYDKHLWWSKNLGRESRYFDDKLGQDWKKKDVFFKNFEKSLQNKK